jgi:signal peptidase II
MLVKGLSIPALNFAVNGMDLNTSRNIIGDFVRLTYIENPGMAFGIDMGGKLFFSIFSIVASLAILALIYKFRSEKLILRFPLALILGGAIGNLIDRTFYGVLFDNTQLFHGRVVDFLDVQFFNINLFGYHLTRWPVFNLADSAVTIGVLLLIIFHRKSAPAEELTDSPLPQVAEKDPATPAQSESRLQNGI